MFNIEFTEVKNPVNHAREIVSDLLKSKWLDSGAFANVYKHGNEVLKVFEDDKGYLAYLQELSELKKQNSYAPVINYVKVFTSGRKKVGLVSMETLTQPKRGTEKNVLFRNTVRQIDTFIETGKADFVVPKELVEMRTVINKAKKSAKLHLCDIHSGNIMLRENDNIVITDPLAY